MAVTVIKNAKLHITSEEFVDAQSLAILDHRIVPMEPGLLEDGTAEEFDVKGCHVCPGFIDLLVNGCAGANFSQTPSVEALEQMRRSSAVCFSPIGSPRLKSVFILHAAALKSSPKNRMTKSMTEPFVSQTKQQKPRLPS